VGQGGLYACWRAAAATWRRRQGLLRPADLVDLTGAATTLGWVVELFQSAHCSSFGVWSTAVGRAVVPPRTHHHATQHADPEQIGWVVNVGTSTALLASRRRLSNALMCCTRPAAAGPQLCCCSFRSC